MEKLIKYFFFPCFFLLFFFFTDMDRKRGEKDDSINDGEGVGFELIFISFEFFFHENSVPHFPQKAASAKGFGFAHFGQGVTGSFAVVDKKVEANKELLLFMHLMRGYPMSSLIRTTNHPTILATFSNFFAAFSFCCDTIHEWP